MKVNTNEYDEVIANSMRFRQCFDLKATNKLCSIFEEKKKGEDGYDPTKKYCTIWDVTVYNLNQYIETAGKDVTNNKTTWVNVTYAEVQYWLVGKKVSKGGQHTMCCDARSRYIYLYMPRHNNFQREAPFTQEGPSDIKRIIDDMTDDAVDER